MEEEGGRRSPSFSGLRADCGSRDLKAGGDDAISAAANGSSHLSPFYVWGILHASLICSSRQPSEEGGTLIFAVTG